MQGSADPPKGGASTPPIPRSFYSPEPPKAPPSPPSSWWRQIPGFRTGTRWKQIVGVLGYLVIATLIVRIGASPALGLFGLLTFAAVWLATNAFGLRTKVPVFRSRNRLAAGGAWTGLGIAMLVTVAMAAPPAVEQNNGVGSGPSGSHTPAAVAQASSRPSPTPSPSPSTTPTPSSSAPPPPAPPAPPPPAPFNYCGAPANPWHYNFCPSDAGKYLYSPDASLCSYFNCIPTFWQTTNGYVAECKDGTYSHSGGVQGACSHHGGVVRPLWA
jgi:hypothetical protein